MEKTGKTPGEGWDMKGVGKLLKTVSERKAKKKRDRKN